MLQPVPGGRWFWGICGVAAGLSGAAVLLAGYPWLGACFWFLGGWCLSRAFYVSASPVATPQVEAQLAQTQKMAQIGQLAASVAHEINNPLAIIRQEAEYIRFLLPRQPPEHCPGLAEIQDSIREILAQVERGREITVHLLDLARPRQPVLQEVQVNRLVEDMARLVEKEAKSKGVELIRNYDPQLPPIHSDGPLLRQVILNLLTNAFYALDQGGRIEVTTARQPPDRIKIVVADNGPGMPPEVLARIFEPFFTTKPAGKGTGLGLALCQDIIRKLGGEISVTSQPGCGATFTVLLPIKLPQTRS